MLLFISDKNVAIYKVKAILKKEKSNIKKKEQMSKPVNGFPTTVESASPSRWV